MKILRFLKLNRLQLILLLILNKKNKAAHNKGCVFP